MPIRGPVGQDESDEQLSLLTHDEENQNATRTANESGFEGNGLPDADRVKGSTSYGTIKGADNDSKADDKAGKNAKFKALAWRAYRSKHRHEIGEKLKNFDMSGLEDARHSQEELKEAGKHNKKLKIFYAAQNKKINDWIEVDAVVRAMTVDVLESFEPQDLDNDGIAEAGGQLQVNREQITQLLPAEEQERRRKEARQARIAINVNVAANILLVIAKAIAVFFSSSLSVIASLTDSVLDLLMTLIIYGTAKLVSWKSAKLSKRYPVGRRRLQPMGTTVFSVIMVVSFLQILQESFTRLIGPDHEIPKLPALAIGSMVGTIGLKGLIWFGCAWQQSSQVQALAQDCKTDVIFNTASLLFPAVGLLAKVWWLDALGAGLLSIYIVFDWAHTCLNHIDHLAGASVDDTTLRKLLFLAWRFSPVVKAYKNIKAYHAGDGVWVEVDLLLEPHTDLRHAHDVAELMQYCYEALGEVDRAFVTVDYAIQGPTGHASLDP